MTPQAAENFFRALGSIRFNKSTMPWLTAACPLAPWRHEHGVDRQPSMGLKTGQHRARVHCFSCNFSGDPESLVAELSMQARLDPKPNAPAMNFRNALRIADEADNSLPDLTVVEEGKRGPNDLFVFPESFWGSFPAVETMSAGWKYLVGETRQLLPEEIPAYRFRWDGRKRRVCVPIRGKDGKLYGVRGRAVDADNSLRYWSYPVGGLTNPQVWYGENEVDFEQPILVTESIFGRIAARRFYRNTIAPLSASISLAQIERMYDAFCFVHLLDADKAGKRASAFLKNNLPHAKHVILAMPDGEDPDSVVRKYGAVALREIIGRVLPIGT